MRVRQKVIGPYIVDFYIASCNLVIELDGYQHGETENLLKDRQRDTYLADHGLTVLRYSNHQIKTNFRDVCEDISLMIEERLSLKKRISASLLRCSCLSAALYYNQ